MKKRILQIIFIAAVLIFSYNFLSIPCAFADTDGSEIVVSQPEKLEIQLGSEWAGAEFQLRTDQGLYPNLIPVGADGVLRLEIGGSGSYILSCVSTGRTMPISHPEAYYTSAPAQSVPSSAPARQSVPAPESLDLKTILRRALENAPEGMRKGLAAALLMAEGYTSREAGMKLHMSANSVRALASRARRYLRESPEFSQLTGGCL